MNDHKWRKLGEVKAFAAVGIAFLDKGKAGFVPDVFSDGEVEALIEANDSHIEEIEAIAKDNGKSDVVDEKAEKTVAKLEKLQDSYLTDEDDWADPMELFEWSGFFFGGAIVHWNVISGAAKKSENDSLEALAEAGLEFHHSMLETAEEKITALAYEE